MCIDDSIDLDKYKRSSVRYCHNSNNQHQSYYLLSLISAIYGTKARSNSMLSKPNQSNNKTRSKINMSNSTVLTSEISQQSAKKTSSAMARATTAAIDTNLSVMTHLIFVLSISYLLIASLSIITNAQLTGQLYQPPSLAPSATLNNQKVAINKHLFSLTNNQQQHPSQQDQLLQKNLAANSNQFRPMLAPNTQSLSPKEQLARPASDAQTLQTAESNQGKYNL